MSFQRNAESLRSKAHLSGTKLPVLVCITALVICIVALAAFKAADLLSNDDFSLAFADAQEGTEQIESAQGAADAGEQAAQEQEAASESAQKRIFVHVSGSVVRPGVVELHEGDRVFDAVSAAGGFADDAAQESVNLARIVQDGEQVLVLSGDEYGQQAGAGASASSAQGSAAAGSAATGGLVNINTADAATLETLPGVGEKTALKIVEDREANGPFASTEDLKRVSGIGDKKFEALSELICV